MRPGPRTVLILAAAALCAAGAGAALWPEAVPAAGRFVREPNLDRSGNDIKRLVLARDAGLEACEAACLATAGCKAYTFVKASDTVPAPICWLKDTVPTGYESSCCTSGVLRP